MQPSRLSPLFIALDHQASSPLQQQLCQRIKQAILSGQLAAGARLPATRQLAQELGVSRNTVINAWAQLQTEGFLISDRQGSRVSRVSRVSPIVLSAAPEMNQDFPHFPLARRVDALHSSRFRASGTFQLLPG